MRQTVRHAAAQHQAAKTRSFDHIGSAPQAGFVPCPVDWLDAWHSLPQRLQIAPQGMAAPGQTGEQGCRIEPILNGKQRFCMCGQEAGISAWVGQIETTEKIIDLLMAGLRRCTELLMKILRLRRALNLVGARQLSIEIGHAPPLSLV